MFLKSFYKHFRPRTNGFLEMYGEWACICEFSIAHKKLNPH